MTLESNEHSHKTRGIVKEEYLVIIMPPTSKKLEGHIASGTFVDNFSYFCIKT